MGQVIVVGLLTLVLGSDTAPSGQLAAAPLSLADLEAMAIQGNPTLAQASASIEHCRAMAQQAGLYPNPTIGYAGDQMGVQGTAGELQGGFLQQRIITAGKLRLSRAKYKQAALEAEIRAHAQQLRVVNSVHLAYYDILADQRQIELRRELLKNAEEALKTHREMFNTGLASEADVLLQETQVSRASIALRAAENRYRADWQHLTAVLGCPQLPPTPLAGALEPDCPPLEWESSLAKLLRDSPAIQLTHAHLVYDQITLQRERVEKIPDIQIQASVGRNYETGNTVAGTQVGIQLPLFNRNQGAIRQVQADLARSQAEVTRVELVLRQRLASVFQSYLTAWKTVKLYQEINLPKTAQAYAVSQDMYQKRRLGWPKVVEMEQRLLQVKSEYTASLLELRKSEVLINGLLLADGLMDPPAATPGGHLEATPTPR
jgi:cobalt-zinc-cadmium efflux system outer membrane protein